MTQALAALCASAIVLFARLVTAVRGLWIGVEPALRQRVYLANHCSHGDFVLLWTALPPRLPTPRTTGQDVFLTTGVPWAYAPGRRYSPLPLPAPSPLAVGGAWSRWSPLPGSPALFSPLLPSDVGGWKGGVLPAPGSAAPVGGGAEPTTPVLLSDLNSMAFGRRAGGEGRRVEAGLGW